MNRPRMIINIISIALLLCFLFERQAHAYLDMGTGSYLLQIAIASFLGVIVTIKIYWKIIKKRLASIFFRKKAPPDDKN